MFDYRFRLDAYNSRTGLGARVTLIISGYSAANARARIGTIYASADGRTVNSTGAVGHGGVSYPEWSIVSHRRIGPAHRCPDGPEVRLSACDAGCKLHRCDTCHAVRTVHRRVYGCTVPAAA